MTERHLFLTLFCLGGEGTAFPGRSRNRRRLAVRRAGELTPAEHTHRMELLRRALVFR